jgi:hypothetical protein
MRGVKIEMHHVDGEYRTAGYSECEKYRYFLKIIWDADLLAMGVIGLNPSTATHLVDDPTLRRVKGFAKGWGYGGIQMLNAFAVRSKDPKILFTHKDPIGPENTLAFLDGLQCEFTLAAWGGNIRSRKWRHYYRGHDISHTIPHLQAFRITSKGDPEHPLYLPSDVKPVWFSYKE